MPILSLPRAFEAPVEGLLAEVHATGSGHYHDMDARRSPSGISGQARGYDRIARETKLKSPA
jgi:hypothetical protein